MKKALFVTALALGGLFSSNSLQASELKTTEIKDLTTIMSAEDERIYKCYYQYSYWSGGRLYHHYRCY